MHMNIAYLLSEDRLNTGQEGSIVDDDPRAGLVDELDLHRDPCDRRAWHARLGMASARELQERPIVGWNAEMRAEESELNERSVWQWRRHSWQRGCCVWSSVPHRSLLTPMFMIGR